MIDRYALDCDWTELVDHFKIGGSNYATPPKYNIAPSQKVPIIIADDEGKRRIGPAEWGLLPRAWGTTEASYRQANVRGEGLKTNAANAKLLQRKRCIIPASGYYQKRSNDKQIFHVKLEGRKTYGIAGIFESFKLESGERLTTFAMIVTEASPTVRHLGQMMPAILAPVDERFWLDRKETDIENLLTVIQPYGHDDLISYPVKDLILNVANDSPECLQPVERELSQEES